MLIWSLSAYPQGMHDVGDFVSSVEHKHRFLTQTVADCQLWLKRLVDIAILRFDQRGAVRSVFFSMQ